MWPGYSKVYEKFAMYFFFFVCLTVLWHLLGSTIAPTTTTPRLCNYDESDIFIRLIFFYNY